jgi:[glutamine synthetase] adenylyltransferase / [glutamine synthetase]-adenylyl-L-tyrosine phosphorylase
MPEIEEYAAALAGGAPDGDGLARFGETEPDRARAAIARALSHRELAVTAPAWLAEALRTARPAFAIEQLAEIAEEAPAPVRAAPARDLVRLLGNSTFLARLVTARPALAQEIAPQEDGLPPPPETASVAGDWDAIRDAKYKGLLRIAARDLGGRPFRAALAELSDLADACLAAALACAGAETEVAPPAVLALGKLGGRELNFSSDVDLLFVYDAPPGIDADYERNRGIARLARAFTAGLEARGAQGFGYRVDLELRPEGPQGPLANSVDAALSYYESFGAEWERQAMIRLRPVAGPSEPALALLRGLDPFVWRRSLSTDALRAVRDMKQRIERERRDAGRDLEMDLKEGPGGIRDVEFGTQALQLLLGGRDPSVRTGNVLDALTALVRASALPEATAEALSRGYLWLRRAEHAVQLDEERQTHAFPREPRAQAALARRMGYRDDAIERARERLLADWSAVRSEVRAHFEALLPGDPR